MTGLMVSIGGSVELGGATYGCWVGLVAKERGLCLDLADVPAYRRHLIARALTSTGHLVARARSGLVDQNWSARRETMRSTGDLGTRHSRDRCRQ